MSRQRGRAGTHTTLIEAAVPVVEALEKIGRVSRGMIKGGIHARTHAVKIIKLPGGLRATVVSKGSCQELHVYGVTVAQAAQALENAALVGYKINLPKC